MSASSRLRIIAVLLGLLCLGLWAARQHVRNPGERNRVDVAASPSVTVARDAILASGSTQHRAAAERIEGTEPARIMGRFLLAGNTPATHALYRLDGREIADLQSDCVLRPSRFTRVTGRAGSDGRWEVRFDPPPALDFTLSARVEDHAPWSASWSNIAPGAIINVGDIQLVKGGTIQGRIIDVDRVPIVGHAWTVWGRSIGSPIEVDGATDFYARVDPLTASFLVEYVTPGRFEVSATSPLGFVRHCIVAIADETVLSLEISIDTTLLSSYLSLWTQCIVPGRPDPKYVLLRGEDGVPQSPLPDNAADAAALPFRFAAPPGASVTLSITDPRYRSWQYVGKLDASIVATLEGTSGLSLLVTGDNGTAPESYAVTIRHCDALGRVTVVYDRLMPQGNTVTGLTPGNYRVSVRRGSLALHVNVEELGAAETRLVTVPLDQASMVRGRVVYTDGRPAAHACVAPITKAQAGDWPQLRDRLVVLGNAGHDDVEMVIADDNGEFAFSLGRSGEYAILAWVFNGSETLSPFLAADDRLRKGRVELVLPRGGVLVGRLIAPEKVSFAGLRLWICPTASDTSGAWSSEVRRAVARDVQPDGRFEVGPVPPGPSDIYLLLPEEKRRLGGAVTVQDGLAELRIGSILIEEGARLERDLVVGDFPGTLAVSTVVNGEGIAGLELELEQEHGNRKLVVRGSTDSHGASEPLRVFSGSWYLTVRDPDLGWEYRHAVPLLARAAQQQAVRVEIQVVSGRVCFLDARTGEPYANRRIALIGAVNVRHGRRSAWRYATTNLEGCANWILPCGEYSFRLEPIDDAYPIPRDERRIANVDWTLTGPLPMRVML